MNSGELFLEVGCEEIPARFVSSLSQDLLEKVGKFLKENRIECSGEAKAYYTSRRLVIWISEVTSRQKELDETVMGPAKRVAFDPQGKPTQAAISFARKCGAKLDELSMAATPKGDYISFRKIAKGRSTEEILKNGMAGIILSLTLPRSMYWAESTDPRFIRPIRWICCLFAQEPIGFNLGGVRAGRFSWGHRILHPKRFSVRGSGDYMKSLNKYGVILDPEDRRKKIMGESKAIVSLFKCNVLEDNSLFETHICLSEHPSLLVGSFDPSHLKLPQEILITVMRDHQKYFSLLDRKGKLLPKFVAVIDNVSDAKGYIRQSHERVLRARLADAEFFWESDLKISLEDRRSMLERMIFQEQLGSYAEKAQRIDLVARWVIEKANLEVRREVIDRAAALCKCDLTTQMVKEFPELQGIVGGLYAQAQNEGEVVARAIYEHYQPESFDSRIPSTLMGKVLSIADKLDSLAGSFSLGHRPSGSKDPFGLRRLAYGIIKVILQMNIPIDLKILAFYSLELHLRGRTEDLHEHGSGMVEFLREHSRSVFAETLPVERDEINAVFSTESLNLCDLRARVEALSEIRGREDFDSLAASFKRIKNILRKSGINPESAHPEIHRELFGQPEEEDLDREVQRVRASIVSLREAGNYTAILKMIAGLRPAVDRFFDKVLVNAEDEALRQNRFNLLLSLYREFIQIVDLSELQCATVKPL